MNFQRWSKKTKKNVKHRRKIIFKLKINMSTITDKQTNDLENILDIIDQDNKREDNVSENKGKPSIDVVDDLSVESNVMGSLALIMAVTKVNDLYSEGDVVTASIENEFETRRISRELFLMVNGKRLTLS